MVKVLVSLCLVGNNVRYNASCLSVKEPELLWLKSNAELVTFCPEVSAGLPIPRAPAEIITGKGVDVLDGLANVVGNDGIDVTEQFVSGGAENALELCKKQQIKYAILAEGSPSCGSSKIYDGTFNGIKIDGSGGVATALLERNGIKVFSQHTIAKLREALEKNS
ncbi:purine nucleoside phosphorylase [Vibrio sp. JCM 18905]|nr:purine nucleoside phosphorylase [Vibrio sp. JCM 18905]